MAIATNQFHSHLQDLYGLGQMQQGMARREYEAEMMRRQYRNMLPQEYAAQEQPANKPQVNKTILLLES